MSLPRLTALTKRGVGEQDHRPRAGDTDAGEVHDDLEGAIREEGVEGNAQQTEGGGHGDAARRHVVTVEFSSGFWCFAGNRQ